MPRVAFFADILSTDFDGASRTMYQLISRIDPAKNDYMFITGHNDMEVNAIDKLTIIETPSWSVPFQKRYKMSLPYLKSKELKAKLKQFAPNVIHISTPSLLGLWALRFANKNNIPVISIFHTYFSSYMQYYFRKIPALGRLLRKFTDWYQRYFYNKCSVIYVPSVSMKNELVSIGVSQNKIEIWERGIDKDLFTPINKDTKYIQALVENDDKNILFVSRLVWEKNLKTLIAVYKEIQNKNLPYNLIIAGSGHAEKAIKKSMPNAIFTGSLSHDKLKKLYASADLLFFPSISETFGNVVLEGLSSGIPALVASKGGTKDMIQDGVNGFILEEDDIQGYVNKISLVLADEELLERLKVNARESSMKYEWSDLSQRYFEKIKALAKPNLS